MQIPKGAVPTGRRYMIGGEVLIVPTPSGDVEVSRQHKQFGKLNKKLQEIEKKRTEANEQANKKKQDRERLIRRLKRNGRK